MVRDFEGVRMKGKRREIRQEKILPFFLVGRRKGERRRRKRKREREGSSRSLMGANRRNRAKEGGEGEEGESREGRGGGSWGREREIVKNCEGFERREGGGEERVECGSVGRGEK